MPRWPWKPVPVATDATDVGAGATTTTPHSLSVEVTDDDRLRLWLRDDESRELWCGEVHADLNAHLCQAQVEETRARVRQEVAPERRYEVLDQLSFDVTDTARCLYSISSYWDRRTWLGLAWAAPPDESRPLHIRYAIQLPPAQDGSNETHEVATLSFPIALVITMTYEDVVLPSPAVARPAVVHATASSIAVTMGNRFVNWIVTEGENSPVHPIRAVVDGLEFVAAGRFELTLAIGDELYLASLDDNKIEPAQWTRGHHLFVINAKERGIFKIFAPKRPRQSACLPHVSAVVRQITS